MVRHLLHFLLRDLFGSSLTGVLLGIMLLVAILGALGVAVAFHFEVRSQSASEPATASPFPPGLSPGTPLALRDRFDGAGNLTWQFPDECWEAEPGRLVSREPAGMALADVPFPNYTFSLRFQIEESTAPHCTDIARILFRVRDGDNYYAVVPRTDGIVELRRMVQGHWQPWLARATIGIDPMKPHTYSVSVSGGRIDVAVDEKPCLRYLDAEPLEHGGVGVASAGAFARVEDVRIVAHLSRPVAPQGR